MTNRLAGKTVLVTAAGHPLQTHHLDVTDAPAIGPGTVDTPGLHDRMRALGDVEQARRMFVARQPMGRLAVAEEIVPIVVYLASDESVFATGQVFYVDGGITI